MLEERSQHRANAQYPDKMLEFSARHTVKPDLYKNDTNQAITLRTSNTSTTSAHLHSFFTSMAFSEKQTAVAAL
jgi:CRISPR/Cas system CSM-associated protein Csm5 (group 7 of RAMP superfamily)